MFLKFLISMANATAAAATLADSFPQKRLTLNVDVVVVVVGRMHKLFRPFGTVVS